MVNAFFSRKWMGLKRLHGVQRIIACLSRWRSILRRFSRSPTSLQLKLKGDGRAPARPFIPIVIDYNISGNSFVLTGLSMSQRIDCAFAHYRFEEQHFSLTYKIAVYGGAGIILWNKNVNDYQFLIRLKHDGHHEGVVGELSITLEVDQIILHRIDFGWIQGRWAGLPTPAVAFIGRQQGRFAGSASAFTAFKLGFPSNAPGIFCFAALQGLVRLLGMDWVAGAIRSEQENHEDFWKHLGGFSNEANGYLIELPFYLKPMSEIPSKRRRRTANRRERWLDIEQSTKDVMRRQLCRTMCEPAEDQVARAAVAR
jgi:hypothetical protein